ncbi:hypothetical protein THRCLA_07634, partial [Thraustotheca clavata]
GHLNIVKWLHRYRNEGCTEEAMDEAATFGHLDIVQYLHHHEIGACSVKALNGAATNGHLHIVQWLHYNQEEGATERAMDGAAGNGHLKVVQWLHEHRNEGCSTRAMDYAALNGHLNVIQWLHCYRQESCTTWAMDWAASKGRLDIFILFSTMFFKSCGADISSSYPKKGPFSWFKTIFRSKSKCTCALLTQSKQQVSMRNYLAVVVHIPPQYKNERDPYHTVGGRRVPYIPSQIAMWREARKSNPSYNPIYEDVMCPYCQEKTRTVVDPEDY